MYLKIKAVAGAKKEKIDKSKDGIWYIWVKAPAENNKANERILEIVREDFPDETVRIVSGHHSPSKIFSVG